VSNDQDFIYLNVPGLLHRYGSQSSDWRSVILAHTKTQLTAFVRNGLIKDSAQALRVPHEDAVVRFSDFTPEGQAFLKTGAVDKWLAACDRKKVLAAYEDIAALEKRLEKFRRGFRTEAS
jgi:hypothetical protein